MWKTKSLNVLELKSRFGQLGKVSRSTQSAIVRTFMYSHDHRHHKSQEFTELFSLYYPSDITSNDHTNPIADNRKSKHPMIQARTPMMTYREWTSPALKRPSSSLVRLDSWWLDVTIISHGHEIIDGFEKSKGYGVLLSGILSRPTTSENETRNWIVLDRWIAVLLDGHVGDSQKCYIDHSKWSKDLWDELRRVHIGKRRLISMLRRFCGYTKSADES